jgi:hypothetical protein
MAKKNGVLMGTLSSDLSWYVRVRWMPFLAERVLRPDRRLRRLLGQPTDADPFDYRDLVNVSALAEQVAAHDVDGESVSNWTRAIRRWVSEDAAPSPNYVRRTLAALGFDWLIGMGRAGYRAHALALLHALWAKGNRKRVSVQAMAIFDRSDQQDILVGHRLLRATASDLERLENAAFACSWIENGAVSIPARCTLPRDFPASGHLFAAKMLLDGAMLSKDGSLEQRLRAVTDGVAREVESWVAGFYPTESRRAQRPRPSKRRTK